jgi:hypothetical protein
MADYGITHIAQTRHNVDHARREDLSEVLGEAENPGAGLFRRLGHDSVPGGQS